MPDKKKCVGRVRPFEKVMAWLEYYEKLCPVYDVPVIDYL
jgi:hypothetical protein